MPVINAITDIGNPFEMIADMYALSKIRKNFVDDKDFIHCKIIEAVMDNAHEGAV